MPSASRSSRGRSSARKRAPLTVEERAARTEAAHRFLIEAVEQLATRDDWTTLLDLSQRLPTYSPRNCVLLMAQGAQGLVMGYQAWRSIPAQGGGFCQVAHGASSLKVLGPVTRTGTEADDVTGEETRVTRVVGFTLLSVFDETALISPPDVPEPTHPQLLAEHAPEQLWQALAAQVRAAGYWLDTSDSVSNKIFPANGRTDFELQIVAVRPDLPPAQRVKTLAHELAHVKLHHPDRIPDGLNRQVGEVEAESVAFLVTAELGLDSSAYSIPYVTGWAHGDTTLVLSTAHRAVSTAREIGDTLQAYLQEPIPDATLVFSPESAAPPADWNQQMRRREEPGQWVRYDAPPLGRPISTATPGAGTASAGRPVPTGPLSPAPRSPGERDTITITTTTGRWEFFWRPEQSTFTAQHVTDPSPLDTDSLDVTRVIGAVPQEITSMGALEQHLGFPLPPTVRAHLEAAHAARPAALSGGRDFSALYAGERGNPGLLVPGEVPTPASLITITSDTTTLTQTYAQAMRAEAPLRRWTTGPVTVEILSTDRDLNPEDSGFQALTYRLTENGQVIFSGDDILSPLTVDPAGDTAIQQVVRLLTQPEDDLPLSPVQTRFLTTAATDLRDQVELPAPPYPPGTRITVTPPAAQDNRSGTTGIVQDAILDRDGTVSSYAWRPDTANLPGHPWQDNPRHTIVSTATTVRATLAEPDIGLNGWNTQIPLSFGAQVTLPDHPSGAVLASVVHAYALDGQWEYDVLPNNPSLRSPDGLQTASTGATIQASAADLVPVLGTAWTNVEAIVQAREDNGFPLVEGEILTAGARLCQVTPSVTGLTLTARNLADVISTTAPAPAPAPSAADLRTGDMLARDQDVVPCATLHCYDAATSTVAVGRPNEPPDISQRCAACTDTVALTALHNGYAAGIRPLNTPAIADLHPAAPAYAIASGAGL